MSHRGQGQGIGRGQGGGDTREVEVSSGSSEWLESRRRAGARLSGGESLEVEVDDGSRVIRARVEPSVRVRRRWG